MFNYVMNKLKSSLVTNRFSKSRLLVFILVFAVIGSIILIKSLAAPNPNLAGDLNGDNTVNIQDLSILLSNYGTSNSTADINNDGTVNVLDLSSLLSHYGQTYTPVSGNWSNAVDDEFNTAGLPSHWYAYQFASTGHTPTAYYSATHCKVPGDGYLHMIMKYEPNGLDGNPGNSWYTCTVCLLVCSGTPSASADMRVTLRWRLVATNGGVAHHNMPLRWPDDGCWPLHGEEDWFEGESATYSTADAFMHYGTDCNGGGNTQLYHGYGSIDLTQWHTYRFQRLTSGTNVDAEVFIDDMTNPVWKCNANTSPACNTTTMPAALKHIVLQQEVPFGGPPDNSGTDGTVDFQVDWLTLDYPA
jgi:hypothetical protein